TGGHTGLYRFDAERGNPTSLMEGLDGQLHGTALGGVFGAGFVFKATLGGVVTTVHDFHGSEGSAPYGQLIDSSDGTLYGTTYGKAGTSDFGTVFKLDSNGILTTLHRFGGLDGGYPYAGLVRATSGVLFGTTAWGGPGGNGVIYVVVP